MMDTERTNDDVILLTTDQWAETANQYRVIDQGIFCVEITTSGMMLLKIGVGNKYYKDLPYVHGGDGVEIDLSKYAKISYVDEQIKPLAVKSDIDREIETITLNIDALTQIAHDHENKNILDNTTASFTKDDKTKLDNIADNANNYTLPIASKTTMGGIKIGDTLIVNDEGLLEINKNILPTTSIMVGATDDQDGEAGAVPKPLAGDNNKYLKGDGTFDTPDGMKYDVFIGATYGYDETYDDDTGEDNTYHISGEGSIGLVPAPPERDFDQEYVNGDMFLRYDGEWAHIPPINEFEPASYLNRGESGLVPAPDKLVVDRFLCSNGQWEHVGDLGYEMATIYEGFISEYRTQIVPYLFNDAFVKVIKSNNDDMFFAPTDGVGLAFGADMENGYMYIDDDPTSPKCYIGGGTINDLAWVREVSFTDHVHDNYVTTNTQQVISGQKIFTSSIDARDEIKCNSLRIGGRQIKYGTLEIMVPTTGLRNFGFEIPGANASSICILTYRNNTGIGVVNARHVNTYTYIDDENNLLYAVIESDGTSTLSRRTYTVDYILFI